MNIFIYMESENKLIVTNEEPGPKGRVFTEFINVDKLEFRVSSPSSPSSENFNLNKPIDMGGGKAE